MFVHSLKHFDPFGELYPQLGSTKHRYSNSQIKANALKAANGSLKTILTNELIERLFTSYSTNHYNINEEDTAVLEAFLLNSKLMTIIDTENQNFNEKASIQSICKNLVSRLHLKRIPKGALLFKINDIGDRCYFLLKGKISILKAKESDLFYSSFEDYLMYLSSILIAKEDFIFTNVLKLNYTTIQIENKAEFDLLLNCFVKSSIQDLIHNNKLTPFSLRKLLSRFNKTLSDYNINEEDIESKYKTLNQSIDDNNQWHVYLAKLTQMTIEESSFYDRKQSGAHIDLNGRLTIKVLTYEEFMLLHQGDFFGDNSLDLIEGKRNATLRAEEDSIVAYLLRDDYLQLISPKQKKVKLKVLLFLYEQFFFASISKPLFAKHYLHFFKQIELNQKGVLFNQSVSSNELMFIYQGQVQVSITCSIVDIHNILKATIERLIQLMPKTMTIGELNNLKKAYVLDPNIAQIRNKSSKESLLFNEMTKRQTFQLYNLNEGDVIGLEEVYLGFNYFTTAVAMSSSMVYLTIDKEKLNTIIKEEQTCIKSFNARAVKKIMIFLARMNQLKTNYVSYMNYKSNQEAKIQMPMHKEIYSNIQSKNSSVSDVMSKVNQLINKHNEEKTRSMSIVNRIQFPELRDSLKKEIKKLLNSSTNKKIMKLRKDSIDIGSNKERGRRKEAIKVLTRNKRFSSNNTSIRNNNSNNELSVSYDMRIRNNYFSIDSLRKETSSMKLLNESMMIMKPLMNQYQDDLNQSQMMINMINIKEMNETEEKIVPYMRKLKVHSLNQGTLNKFQSYKKSIGKRMVNLSQSDIMTSSRSRVNDNGILDQFNNNLVVEAIKSYDRNIKLSRYSLLGLGKNTYNKRNYKND